MLDVILYRLNTPYDLKASSKRASFS